MKPFFLKFFLIACAGSAIVMLFIACTFEVTKYQVTPRTGFEIREDYQRETVNSTGAATGRYYYFYMDVRDVDGAYANLVFYTKHTNVRIYLDDELIYSVIKGNSAFSKSPGGVWNMISLNKEDNGRKIKIILEPVYKSDWNDTITFYYGEQWPIMQRALAQNAVGMYSSMILIILGMTLIAYVLGSFNLFKDDEGIGMLGVFSVMVGLWKITDTTIIKLFFPQFPMISNASFILLMILPIPYVLFFKEFFRENDGRFWYYSCALSAINICINYLMQFLDVLDFKQMMWMTYLSMAGAVVVTVGYEVYEIFRYGWDARMKRNMVCIIFCGGGMVFDMIAYKKDMQMTTLIGMGGLIIFVVYTAFNAMKETRYLIEEGQKASSLETMAHHDQLTGLLNRNAYAEYISRQDFNPDQVFSMVFDLNDLKKVNDIQGHDVGDVYIKEAANIIARCFSDLGRCFRMGGDEFRVIVTGGRSTECKLRIEQLRTMEDSFREQHPNIDMHIAVGYALYNVKSDHTIEDTSRRADKMMYKNKMDLKTTTH